MASFPYYICLIVKEFAKPSNQEYICNQAKSNEPHPFKNENIFLIFTDTDNSYTFHLSAKEMHLR